MNYITGKLVETFQDTHVTNISCNVDKQILKGMTFESNEQTLKIPKQEWPFRTMPKFSGIHKLVWPIGKIRDTHKSKSSEGLKDHKG